MIHTNHVECHIPYRLPTGFPTQNHVDYAIRHKIVSLPPIGHAFHDGVPKLQYSTNINKSECYFAVFTLDCTIVPVPEFVIVWKAMIPVF